MCSTSQTASTLLDHTKPHKRTTQRHSITVHHNTLHTPLGHQCQGFGTSLTTYATDGFLLTGGHVPLLRFECPLREVDPQGTLQAGANSKQQVARPANFEKVNFRNQFTKVLRSCATMMSSALNKPRNPHSKTLSFTQNLRIPSMMPRRKLLLRTLS